MPDGEQFVFDENGAKLWEIGRAYFVGLVVTPHQELALCHLNVLQGHTPKVKRAVGTLRWDHVRKARRNRCSTSRVLRNGRAVRLAPANFLAVLVMTHTPPPSSRFRLFGRWLRFVTAAVVAVAVVAAIAGPIANRSIDGHRVGCRALSHGAGTVPSGDDDDTMTLLSSFL